MFSFNNPVFTSFFGAIWAFIFTITGQIIYQHISDHASKKKNREILFYTFLESTSFHNLLLQTMSDYILHIHYFNIYFNKCGIIFYLEKEKYYTELNDKHVITQLNSIAKLNSIKQQLLVAKIPLDLINLIDQHLIEINAISFINEFIDKLDNIPISKFEVEAFQLVKIYQNKIKEYFKIHADAFWNKYTQTLKQHLKI